MTGNSSNSGRILIVDDDHDARDILVRLLTREGYTCIEAADGPQCLEAVEREAIDVILLDVMMPGMDGLEVCERLQKEERLRAIPVILLTAKDDMQTRSRGMALGVSEYLTKPINRAELFARVQSQVRARELERQLERTVANIDKVAKE